jgi:hypothetical protein
MDQKARYSVLFGPFIHVGSDAMSRIELVHELGDVGPRPRVAAVAAVPPGADVTWNGPAGLDECTFGRVVARLSVHSSGLDLVQ